MEEDEYRGSNKVVSVVIATFHTSAIVCAIYVPCLFILQDLCELGLCAVHRDGDRFEAEATAMQDNASNGVLVLGECYKRGGC